MKTLLNGHTVLKISSLDGAQEHIKSENWTALDQFCLQQLAPGGEIRTLLMDYAEFNSIEHILALRENPDDEGIWHDDGSRKLAFSCSLTLDHESVKGGHLFLRQKEGEKSFEYETQPFATLIIFATGQNGWEHRVSAVTAGKRLILAGWCT